MMTQLSSSRSMDGLLVLSDIKYALLLYIVTYFKDL